MKPICSELKNKCIDLRTNKRKSLKEISKETGVSKATLSQLLRNNPLTEEEIKLKHISNIGRRKYQKNRSAFYDMLIKYDLSPTQAANAAEAAVLFRLCICGCSVFSSQFDGETIDFVAKNRKGKIIKIQVKLAMKKKFGMPVINLCKNHSRKKYDNSEMDFLIAYDLYCDKAYVFSYNDLSKNKTTISTKIENEEKWDKIDQF